MLQHEVEKEHACHFKVRIRKCARLIIKGYNGLADVIRPLHSPDDGGQWADSSKPDATHTEQGGVAKTHVAWFMYNKLQQWDRHEVRMQSRCRS